VYSLKSSFLENRISAYKVNISYNLKNSNNSQQQYAISLTHVNKIKYYANKQWIGTEEYGYLWITLILFSGAIVGH
jgi:hypothetical protein